MHKVEIARDVSTLYEAIHQAIAVHDHCGINNFEIIGVLTAILFQLVPPNLPEAE